MSGGESNVSSVAPVVNAPNAETTRVDALRTPSLGSE